MTSKSIWFGAAAVVLAVISIALARSGGCSSSDDVTWTLNGASVGLVVAAARMTQRGWLICVGIGLGWAVLLIMAEIAVSGIGECIS